MCPDHRWVETAARAEGFGDAAPHTLTRAPRATCPSTPICRYLPSPGLRATDRGGLAGASCAVLKEATVPGCSEPFCRFALLVRGWCGQIRVTQSDGGRSIAPPRFDQWTAKMSYLTVFAAWTETIFPTACI
jgi:hypothetical protein